MFCVVCEVFRKSFRQIQGKRFEIELDEVKRYSNEMDEIGKFKSVQAKINKIQTQYSENYICSGGNSEKSVDVFNGLNWYCQGRYCSSIAFNIWMEVFCPERHLSLSRKLKHSEHLCYFFNIFPVKMNRWQVKRLAKLLENWFKMRKGERDSGAWNPLIFVLFRKLFPSIGFFFLLQLSIYFKQRYNP